MHGIWQYISHFNCQPLFTLWIKLRAFCSPIYTVCIFCVDMIVSGLPTRNGDTHAGEIATTAMDLMSAIGGFRITHMPDTKLRLRAGIHTGTRCFVFSFVFFRN